MVARAKAYELVEDLASIEASIGDVIGLELKRRV